MTLEKEFMKHLQEEKLEEQKRVAKEIIDAHIKILSASYDKAIAYTNIIIIAGYASFFAMWSFTKEFLSPREVLWSALIMSISIVTFVFFEVYKMYFTSWALLSLANVTSDPGTTTDPNKLLAGMQEHDKQARERVVRFGRIWHRVLIVTVSSALVAIGILFCGFIRGLLG